MALYINVVAATSCEKGGEGAKGGGLELKAVGCMVRQKSPTTGMVRQKVPNYRPPPAREM